MKYRSFILIFLITLFFSAAPLQAQAPVSTIDVLTVDLWPDFDQEAVLVLLTGTLPNPGTVTIPLPPDADFHVLARIDDQGTMFDDLEAPTISNGMMTFDTPDMRFRIEYYMPYTSSGNQRSFTYTWQAAISVDQFSVTVQQPAAAISLTTNPSASGQAQNQDDGLIYHNLPLQTIAAGQLVTVQVNYTMSSNTLTVVSNPPITTNNSATTGSVATDNRLSTWAYVLGGVGLLFIAVAVTWQIATRSASTAKSSKQKPQIKRPSKSTPSKPAPARKAAPIQAESTFCHECGTPSQPNDQFCRSCGTKLKRP